ncbi:MAG: 3-dehydro-L-gulonate 2-dehydrogenase [bacterium]|nr:3-dehydro-L-gulonate 2-dehydrogenase [bacterium]
MERVLFERLYEELYRILTNAGFSKDRAELVARLFAENQRDGVYSHGINRFPGFVEGIQKKQLDIHAEPECVQSLGVIERWDGKMGIGLVNAHRCMGRAIEIAKEHGMGCVGLKNTNHWMRAGAYGLQAADAGCIGICWTNTTPLMPPWGSADVKIGNNPMVIAVPKAEGHILLDMAMSQYSNGKLEVLKRQGKKLPLAGGFDSEGELTLDPGAILESRRALPIGYWKGSALAIVLDTMGTIISGGQSTHQIGRQGAEYAVSQVYIAIDVTSLAGEQVLHETVNAIVQDVHTAHPLNPEEDVRYPGEGMLRIRRESMEKGVWMDAGQWEALLAM